MQGRSAFKHVHAMLAADYAEQRGMILNSARAELAKLGDAEALKQHNAAVLAVHPYPELLTRPAYNSLYSKVLQGYKTPGNRCHTLQFSTLAHLQV